jgi:hypothetical protein
METADPLEVEQFLELLRVGSGYDEEGRDVYQAPMGEMTAALAVGWTPRKLKALKKDPEFVQLVNEARTLLVESVESVAIRNALRGNQRAIELFLFCHAADRGWRPPAHRHEVIQSGKVDISIVASVKEAVKAHLAAGGSIAELQEAPPVIDAEIVDGSEDS